MKYAIKLTQVVKQDNNDLFFNKEVNSIFELDMPNDFVHNGFRYLGFQNRKDLHSLLNIKELVRPSGLNSSTHKLGDIIELETTFSYEVVELSTEELEAIELSKITKQIPILEFWQALKEAHGVTYTMVSNVINSLEDEDLKDDLIMFKNASVVFKYQDPLLYVLAPAFSLTNQNIDNLFKNY